MYLFMSCSLSRTSIIFTRSKPPRPRLHVKVNRKLSFFSTACRCRTWYVCSLLTWSLSVQKSSQGLYLRYTNNVQKSILKLRKLSEYIIIKTKDVLEEEQTFVGFPSVAAYLEGGGGGSWYICTQRLKLQKAGHTGPYQLQLWDIAFVLISGKGYCPNAKKDF